MVGRYAFSLTCMAGIGSRNGGSQGEMVPVQHLPIDEDEHDIAFMIRDRSVSFEPFVGEDKNHPPDGTKGWFCKPALSRHHAVLTYTDTSPVAHGTKLGLQTYTDHVTVEAPFTNLLPNDLDFTQTQFHRTEKTKEKRMIYLRPHDVVFFQERACRIRVDVDVVDASGTSIVNQRSGNRSFATSEIQVKSSAQQPLEAGNSLVQETPADADTDDDDENDLDAIATPAKADDITPATSRPTDAIAVKDTPSRPLSRGSNLVFSTAPDKAQSQSLFDDINDNAASTPAARAGAIQSSRVKQQQSPSAGSDSQLVFGNALRGQKTYGGTPKQRRQKITPQKEILESPEKLRLDQPSNEGNDTGTEDEIAVLPGPSPTALKLSGNSADATTNRKRKADEDTAVKPLSITPPTKKARGGRQRKPTQIAEDDVEHPPSTGKLRKPGRKSFTKGELEDDDDEDDDNAIVAVPRSKDNIAVDKPSSTTPQSSGTHPTTKPPNKILLSKSKYAEDKKVKAWLRKHNATIDDQVPGKRTNFVCVVGKGVLGTTAKVVRSLALGKKVVTDQWLEDSMSQDQLLDLEPYIHDDLRDTATINRSKLFAGKTLFFTSALKASYGERFEDVDQLATEAGATNVEFGTAKKAVGKSSASTIFLGLEGDDRDALILTEEGRTVYQKDLLTQSIIRGELLCDGEDFTWQSGSAKGRKGRKK